MSAALRGLSQGLQTGLQLGSVLRDARMRRALQEEAAKYGVTEDAGISQEQIGRAQAETAGLAAQDAAEFGLEAPQQFRVEEAQPVAPSFRVGDQTFKTREEATRGARPLRAEGLARVYEQYGDIERAEELRERADAGRFRQVQMESAEIGLRGQRQEEKERDNLAAFDAEFRPDMRPDEIKALAAKHNLTRAQQLGVVEQLTGLQEGELKQFDAVIKNLMKGKNLSGIVDLYNNDDRFDPSIGLRTSKGKDGKVTLEFFDVATGQVTERAQYGSEALAVQDLNIRATDPAKLAEWSLGIRAKEAQIDLVGAQTRLAGAQAAEVGQSRARPMSEADITTRARAMVDLGTPDPDNPNNTISFGKALQIVRHEATTGKPYESQAERLARLAADKLEEERRTKKDNQPDAPTAATTPTRGLFTDPQGRTQLLEPFSRFDAWRRRLVDEQNARDAASGLGSAGF